MEAADLRDSRLFLVAFGLDTVAELRLNGQLAAVSRNMFTRLRVEVTPLLLAGANRLEVLFLSPVVYGKLKSDQYQVGSMLSLWP